MYQAAAIPLQPFKQSEIVGEQVFAVVRCAFSNLYLVRRVRRFLWGQQGLDKLRLVGGSALDRLTLDVNVKLAQHEVSVYWDVVHM